MVGRGDEGRCLDIGCVLRKKHCLISWMDGLMGIFSQPDEEIINQRERKRRDFDAVEGGIWGRDMYIYVFSILTGC